MTPLPKYTNQANKNLHIISLLTNERCDGQTLVNRQWLPRLGTGVLGFLVGYALSIPSGNHAVPPSGLVAPIAFRNRIDDASWKCVSLFRGQPKNPKLSVESGSQVGQDRTVLDIFKHKRDGTFLDLASNDAVRLSNTVALEQQHGWTGLCVEPNPLYTVGYIHRTCRLVQAVVGPEDGLGVDFNFRGANGAFGGITGFDNKANNKTNTERHYTVSVGKILRDFGMPRTIDYLSLDIEGAEAWVFESFPWDAYIFLVATIERPKPELKALLENYGYKYLCNHGTFRDEMWVHETLPNFREVVGEYFGRKQCRGK